MAVILHKLQPKKIIADAKARLRLKFGKSGTNLNYTSVARAISEFGVSVSQLRRLGYKIHANSLDRRLRFLRK